MNLMVRAGWLLLLAILSITVGVGLFLLFYFKGEELLPHQTVLVPKDGQRVEVYTTITASNVNTLFDTKEMLSAAVSPSAVTLENAKNILNKTVVIPLYPEDVLTTNHLRDVQLVPRPGEIEYPIPASWLEVLDWTGRPGDEVEIWLSPGQQVKQYYNNKVGKGERLDIVPETPERPLTTAFLNQIRLRYVMDSTNKTVRNKTDGDGLDRTEATGEPVKVKANLTAEQYGKLKGAIDEGYKLILVSKGTMHLYGKEPR
ncbi:hypothetical protein [Paenibacillus sp. y28]|uniref:hypothetical protein n=1 Tax=Paenibacillus sp. y28 TaxID=3129110 RepID=UPI00301853D5